LKTNSRIPNRISPQSSSFFVSHFFIFFKFPIGAFIRIFYLKKVHRDKVCHPVVKNLLSVDEDFKRFWCEGSASKNS
jgi:hypothetical protein